MSELYAVFKDGVYRHECGGIFDDIELAKSAARKLIGGERDDYHNYEVVPFELNKITHQTEVVSRGGGKCDGGNLEERNAIFWVKRVGGKIEEYEDEK